MDNKTDHEPTKEKPAADDVAKKPPLVWDCGSSLYDSFELKSFERQLDSALASRSLSMPHLSDRRIVVDHDLQPPPPSSQPKKSPYSSPTSRISRSLQKLIKSVFRPKQTSNHGLKHLFRVPEPYIVYDKSDEALTTIPEAPEYDTLSPEIKSLVRRTASDRFTAASVGISCA